MKIGGIEEKSDEGFHPVALRGMMPAQIPMSLYP
jgi:hypothetical protein